jgi:hypothetical protein
MVQSICSEWRGGCGADESEPESVDRGPLHVYELTDSQSARGYVSVLSTAALMGSDLG